MLSDVTKTKIVVYFVSFPSLGSLDLPPALGSFGISVYFCCMKLQLKVLLILLSGYVLCQAKGNDGPFHLVAYRRILIHLPSRLRDTLFVIQTGLVSHTNTVS